MQAASYSQYTNREKRGFLAPAEHTATSYIARIAIQASEAAFQTVR